MDIIFSKLLELVTKPLWERLVKTLSPKQAKLTLTFVGIFLLTIFGVSIAYRGGWRTNIDIYNINKTAGTSTNEIDENTNRTNPFVPFNPSLVEKPSREELCGDAPYCSLFLDEEEWDGWSGFAKATSDPRVLRAEPEDAYDNPNLWFKPIQPSPTLRLELTVELRDDAKGNVVIAFGNMWRIIIAESNFNAVTCEENYSDESKKVRYPDFLTSHGRYPIKAGTQLVATVESRLTSENKLEVALRLDYVDANGDPDSTDFICTIAPPAPDVSTLKKPVGVGIIDSNDEGIRVKFISFKLWPKD